MCDEHAFYYLNRMTQHVQTMFSAIARRYDAANSVLSLGIHHRWRRQTVHLSQVRPGMEVLDCATGTGDLAFAYKRAVGRTGVVTGTDLNADMLAVAIQKSAQRRTKVQFLQADAQHLPFPSNRFDVTSIAFGIRNVDDPVQALREMLRVTRPDGRVVVLEFGQPRGIWGSIYRMYSRIIVPTIGKLITGYKAPYQYLPATASVFPAGTAFLELMNKAGGFRSCTMKPLNGGIAYVYVGVRDNGVG